MSNHFFKYTSLYSSTLSTGISTGTGETITPAGSGLPEDTEITLTIDRVDSSGKATPTKMERIRGTFDGVNLTSYTRGVDQTNDQAHSAGAVVEMVWNAKDWNDAVDGVIVEHNQDGTHKAATVTTLKASGANITTGTSDGTIVTPKSLADAGVNLSNGWILANETWAYASPTTITVPAGALLKYSTDDKIRIIQTTTKYFYVLSVDDTLLTVTGGSDYTVTNAAIASPYYSHEESPFLFPSTFNWTPTLANITNTNGTLSARFSLSGKTCYFIFKFILGSSSAIGTGPTFTTPLTAVNVGAQYVLALYDASTSPYFYTGVGIQTSTTVISLYCTKTDSTYLTATALTATVPFTFTTSDELTIIGSFDIA